MKANNYLLGLIGSSKESVLDKLAQDDVLYRIIQEDNIHYMITCDMEINRLNLIIKAGIVVEVEIG